MSKKEPKKFEHKTMETALWLAEKAFGKGFKGMNYPRWEGIRYCAKETLSDRRYLNKYDLRPIDKRAASVVIGFQPFSGLRGEWVEWRFGTVFRPSEKYNADPCQ